MSANITKEYTNGEVTIVWKPGTCIHSELCRKGLPSVFDPNARPWINAEGATSQELIDQIGKCPSGALSWYYNKDGKPKAEAADSTKIDVIPNGPLRIHGSVEITHSNEAKENRDTITALCRCGQSTTKPYCDGTHKRVGWEE
jgi:uncharacterized Fe-S cluster protein YjdI